MTGAPEQEEAASNGGDGQIRETLAEAEGQSRKAIARERRDAREAQDRTDTQRRDAREAQDQIEAAQDSERRDAEDSFDTRRDGERREAFEERVAERQHADALEQANQNLEAFAYTASHDLRAPLRTMSGYSALLLEEYGPGLGAEGRGYAEKIHVASQQMAQLIDALLRLPRLSRDQVSLQPVDLGAEAVAIAAELRAAEPRRQVDFDIQQPAWAMADRSLIRTVLQNLLGNAWKFTSGQDSARIEVATVPEGGASIRCSVRDNGVGFDPAQTGKLFIAFHRLHPASQFPGTGIGLASVRRIVELHGGRVGAISAIGEGATFSFTLPAADAA